MGSQASSPPPPLPRILQEENPEHQSSQGQPSPGTLEPPAQEPHLSESHPRLMTSLSHHRSAPGSVTHPKDTLDTAGGGGPCAEGGVWVTRTQNLPKAHTLDRAGPGSPGFHGKTLFHASATRNMGRTASRWHPGPKLGAPPASCLHWNLPFLHGAGPVPARD